MLGNAATSQQDVVNLLAGAKELHKRILFVLGALIVYRLGTHIPLPGIDPTALSAYANQLQQGLFGLFNVFSGGAFSRMAVFSLSVFPYITASIIFQLLVATTPKLKELKQEGEPGRRKIAQYTKYLTVLIAFGQGFGLASGIMGQTVGVNGQTVALVPAAGILFQVQTALCITAGTLFLMWVGERITARGIGNGISLLIFAGIVAQLPSAIYQLGQLLNTGSIGGFTVLAIVAGFVAILAFCVFMELAQRRLTVQYPKRNQGPDAMMQQGSHLPLKLNLSGVMPPIFASALLMAPITMASFAADSAWAQFVSAWFSPGRPLYIVTFAAMIIFFTFFYTATVAFNTEETAENLKNNGGFIPGVRPGQPTAKYLDFVVTRITVIGAAYITLVCVIPEILHGQQLIPVYFGGTSILIMVTVTIDTMSRIQSFLIAQRYEGLLKQSLFGKRRGGPRQQIKPGRR